MTSGEKQNIKSGSGKKPKRPEKSEKKVELSQDEYRSLKALADSASECSDKMLRALAELENSRKRLEKEKKDFWELANQELIADLLPVLDNFERALAALPQSTEEAPYRQGIEMIYKQLKEVLGKEGLKEIKAQGEHFDPFFHEAVQQEASDTHPDQTVLEELMKGYLLRGKLLRPAAVKVSSRPVEDDLQGGTESTATNDDRPTAESAK